MAYIPPHKRHLKDKERPPPTPDLLVPQFQKNLNIRSSRNNKEDKRKNKNTSLGGKIVYSNNSVSRWWVAGLGDDQFSSSVHLEPISLEEIERKYGEKPLVLVANHSIQDDKGMEEGPVQRPWLDVVQNLKQDLLSSSQRLINEVSEAKPMLVARFGRILFHRSPSLDLENARKSFAGESTLRQLKRSFYTNIPASYMENILTQVVPKVGVDFEAEKKVFHVKLSDSMQPDSIISCKCNLVEGDKKLQLYKIELNQVRHLVLDISCPNKNLDLRLMLSSKRILTDIPEEEKDRMRDLIGSAVIDGDVKGGLRWPLGKESSGDRYTVVGVWHTDARTYKSSSVRLKVRNADRFDFKTSVGEVTREVSLKMTGIVSQLQENNVNKSLVSESLENTLKLIWEHFLQCDSYLL